MKSKVVKGVITLVSVVLVVAVCYILFGGYIADYLEKFFPSQDKLPTVTGVTHNVDSNGRFFFSWNTVEGANRYGVIIGKYEDGEWQQDSPKAVEENKYYYSADAEKISVKVQAQDSTGEKANSDWCDEYIHEIPLLEITYDSASLFVSSMLPSSYNLLKLVNISIDGNAIRTNAIFESENKIEMYELYTYYEDGITSLQDCIQNKVPFTSIRNHYEVVDYNSADYLLQSNSFIGQMEEYRLQGYTFEVVSQHVAKPYEGNRAFFIYATYKLTKGDEVKYINNKMTVGLKEESPNEKENYTKKVANVEERQLREEFCHELVGDEIILAQEMEKLYKQQ